MASIASSGHTHAATTTVATSSSGGYHMRMSARALEASSRIDIAEGEAPIILHNVCAAVDLGVSFNDQQLGHIAQNCRNCEHKGHKLLINIRSPRASATLFRSGKMVVLGALSAALNHLACRRLARRIQKCGYPMVRIRKFMLTNVCGSYEPVESFVSVDLQAIADHESRRNIEIDYEPEIKPALTWQMKDPKSTFNIFANGKMNVVGCNSEQDLVQAFKMVLPVLKRYHREMSEADRAAAAPKKTRKRIRNDGNAPAAAIRRLATTAEDMMAVRPTGYITMNNSNNNNGGAPSTYYSTSSSSSDDGPPPLDHGMATPAMPLPQLEPETPAPPFQPPTPSSYHASIPTNNHINNGHTNGHHALVSIPSQPSVAIATPNVTAAPPPPVAGAEVVDDFDGWT